MTEYTKWKSLVDLQEYSAIPDSDIYLHDDWGDNQLTGDREGSGTTTHNGVTGFYRPGWIVDAGSPDVSGEQLTITPNEQVRTEININLDENLTASLEADVSDSGGSGSDQPEWTLFAETSNWVAAGNRVLDDGYSVGVYAGDSCRLAKYSGGGLDQTLISGQELSDVHTIEVTRTSSGTWELFVDGSSQGTATDTEFTNPQYTGFGSRDNGQMSLDEIKVS